MSLTMVELSESCSWLDGVKFFLVLLCLRWIFENLQGWSRECLCRKIMPEDAQKLERRRQGRLAQAEWTGIRICTKRAQCGTMATMTSNNAETRKQLWAKRAAITSIDE